MTLELLLPPKPPPEVPLLVATKVRWATTPMEWKVVAMREAPVESDLCDTPELVAAYYRKNIVPHPYFDPDCESAWVLFLNVRRKIKGHVFISKGTIDTLLVTPAAIFRSAVMVSAASIIFLHNHPSGDSTPSEADVKITRDLIKAGQLLKIELLDSLVMGRGEPGYTSLRQLGYFYS